MTISIKRASILAMAIALLITGLLGAVAVSDSQAAARKHFDGRVLSKDNDSKTFRANTEQRGIVRFHVNNGTDFERIPGGFSGLEPGMKVEVIARRADNGNWIALKVERRRNSSGPGRSA